MPFACRFVLPVTLPAASFTDPAAFFVAPSILFVLIALVLSCVVEPLPCDQRGCQARGSPSTPAVDQPRRESGRPSQVLSERSFVDGVHVDVAYEQLASYEALLGGACRWRSNSA